MCTVPSATEAYPSRADIRCAALAGELQRYAYWASPRSRWVMSATNLLGWRLSRVVRSRLGRPDGALSWPMGLGLLPLNSRTSPLKSIAQSVVNQALCGFERQPTIHVDWGGVLYGALGLYESLGDIEGIERVQRLAVLLLEREGADEGEITYAAHREEVLIDTLGMICPMLARLSRLTGDARYRGLALRQLGSFLKKGVDSESGWPWHGYHRLSGKWLGVPGWGRGVGWLMLGLVDTALEIPPGEDGNTWSSLAWSWMDRLARVQATDGHWPWLLTDRTACSDSSVTAMLGYAACRLSLAHSGRDDICTAIFEQAFNALDGLTDSGGRIHGASGEAVGWGLYSQQFGNHLWVQGPAVALQCIREENTSARGLL